MLNEDFKAAMTIERFKSSGMIGILKVNNNNNNGFNVRFGVRRRHRGPKLF